MYKKITLLVISFIICLAAASGTVVADTHVTVSGSETEASPGSNATVTFTLSNDQSKSISGAAIDITSVPEGWTVTNTETNGGSYKESDRQFIWLKTSGNSEQTGSITLAVPEDAAGEYKVTAESVVDGSTVDSDSATVSVASDQGPGDSKTDSGGTNQGFDAVLSFDNVQSIEQNRVKATVSVRNRADETLQGPAVEIEPPEGWRIVEQNSGGATYNRNTNQWIWLSFEPQSQQSFTFTMQNTRESIDPDAEIQANLIVDGETAITTTAEYQEEPTTTGDDSPNINDDTPGFGFIIAIISILLSTGYMVRE